MGGLARRALVLAAALGCGPALACPDAIRAPRPDDIGPLIDALKHQQQHPDPDCAAAVGRVFVRARFGALPEDPDIFERALRILQAAPPDQAERALREGVAPELAAQVWGSLNARALSRLDAHAPPTAAEAAAIAPEAEAALLEAWARHGPALLDAFSTEGGSVLGASTVELEGRLLAGWLRRADAHDQRLAVGLARELGLSQANLRAALRALSGGSDPELAEMARSALLPMGEPRGWGLEPPTVPPGQVAGAPPADLGRPPLPPPPPPGAPRPPLAAIGLGLACAGLLGLTVYLRRRWLLPAAALALLVLLELGLRAAGAPTPADQAPLFSFIPSGAQFWEPVPGRPDRLRSAGGSTRRREIDRQPAPGGRRVAVLGASSVHGSHYLAEEAFPALLEASLQAAPAGLGPVEVLNMGVGGSTSAGVLSTGLEALSLKADLLVIYQGHNDAAQFTRLAHFAPALGRLRLRMHLHQSPLMGLMRRLIPEPRDGQPSTMPAFDSAAPDHAEVAALSALAVEHLEWNHRRLIRAARAAGVPVLLCVPATNLALAHVEPFATPPGDEPELRRLYDEARAAAAAGDPERAAARLQDRIDASASPRELTRPAIAALRRVAAEEAVPLIDLRAELLRRSPDGFSQNGLYWDDLHPSRAGHQLISAALLPSVRAALGQRPSAETP